MIGLVQRSNIMRETCQKISSNGGGGQVMRSKDNRAAKTSIKRGHKCREFLEDKKTRFILHTFNYTSNFLVFFCNFLYFVVIHRYDTIRFRFSDKPSYTRQNRLF